MHGHKALHMMISFFLISGNKTIVNWMGNFRNPSGQSFNASYGEFLSFEWSGNHAHNVYLFPDQTAFDSCNFSAADFLSSSSPTTFTIDSFPTYFGSKMTCNAGHKLAVLSGTVTFIDKAIKYKRDVYEPL